jgi:hypothetical protein
MTAAPHPRRPERARSGLTLFELMMSIALSAFVIATATAAVFQMREMSARMQVLQRMNDTARTIFERFTLDVSTLQQTVSFFVTSTAPSGGVPGRIEVVFMRGKYTPLDFMVDDNFGNGASRPTDLVWTRWSMDDATAQIGLSASSQKRKFTVAAATTATAINTAWTTSANPNGISYNGAPFMALPTPQRAIPAGATAAATLDQDAYGTGSPGDIGDYQDLLNNNQPIAFNASNFCVEVVRADGTTQTFTTAASASLAANGLYVDGRNTIDMGARPRLIRIRFDLSDPRTGVHTSFSFSFQPPAFLPAN